MDKFSYAMEKVNVVGYKYRTFNESLAVKYSPSKFGDRDSIERTIDVKQFVQREEKYISRYVQAKQAKFEVRKKVVDLGLEVELFVKICKEINIIG